MKHVELKPACPVCGTEFTFKSNKKYCSKSCSRNATRPKQNSRKSPSKKNHNKRFFEEAKFLAECLYDLPPAERLGYMKDLVDRARAGDTRLREILSNYKLRRANPEESWWFPRGSAEYLTIAQAAQNYCRRFWWANVSDVVYCRAREPDTGESSEDCYGALGPRSRSKPSEVYVPELGSLAMQVYCNAMAQGGVTVKTASPQ